MDVDQHGAYVLKNTIADYLNKTLEREKQYIFLEKICGYFCELLRIVYQVISSEASAGNAQAKVGEKVVMQAWFKCLTKAAEKTRSEDFSIDSIEFGHFLLSHLSSCAEEHKPVLKETHS